MNRLSALCLVFLPAMLSAQSEGLAPDFLRSVGKIYVVVGVIVLVFLGLSYYLWTLDRRAGRLEEHFTDHVN